MNNFLKGKITPRELFFSAAAFVQGSSLLTSFFVGSLKQNSWIGVLAAYLISLAMISLYLFLMKKHPGMNLVQLNEAVLGKIMGKVISFLYFFYFFSLIPLHMSDINAFMGNYMMPETPPIAITILFLLVVILAVRKGIDSVFRLGPFFSIMQIFVLLLFTLLLIPNMKPSNMLPLFDISLKEFIQGINTIVGLPFNQLIIFMLFLPLVTEQSKVTRSLFGGYSLGAAVMLMIVLADTAVLGPLLGYFTTPRYESVRLIDVYDVISRMDIIFGLVLIILRFFKVSILLYGTSLCLAQIFELKDYVPLVSTLGVLAAFFSLFVFHSAAETGEWGQQTAGIYNSLFNILLPLITFLVYLVRALITKLKAKKAKTRYA